MAARGDQPDTSWIVDAIGGEVTQDGPPVGSVAVGAFGIGFDVVRPDTDEVVHFDPRGNRVDHSLIGLADDRAAAVGAAFERALTVAAPPSPDQIEAARPQGRQTFHIDGESV